MPGSRSVTALLAWTMKSATRLTGTETSCLMLPPRAVWRSARRARIRHRSRRCCSLAAMTPSSINLSAIAVARKSSSAALRPLSFRLDEISSSAYHGCLLASGDQRHDVLDALQADEGGLDLLGPWEQLERRGGDDAERTFAADEEVLQIVARVVLAQAAQPVPGPAIGQHRLDAERQLPHVAIAQDVDAAGIGREVAADLARAFGAEAERKQPVGDFADALGLGEDAAGLDGHGEVQRVERPHAVHPTETDKDAVLRRHRPAAETGIAALRIDRQTRGGANPDQLGHLGGRGRAQHGQR